MLTLYIVRHGETEWNVERRIQGRLNSGLTAKGREYAKHLGERLKNVPFTMIFSSPSQRTMETAQLIKGSRDISIKEDESLMEMNMGPWQGLTIEEIKDGFPQEYECFINRPDLYQNHGAESYGEMRKRAETFLHELNHSELCGNLLVVTHGLMIKTLYGIFKDIELKDLSSEPVVQGTSLTIVKLDQGQAELVLQGDMSHIAG